MTPGGPLTPAPEFAFIPCGEEPTILGRLDANSPVYAKPLYAHPAVLSHIAGVDDGDLGMLHTTSPIRHLVDPLLDVRLKLAFCMTCAVCVLALAQGPSF